MRNMPLKQREISSSSIVYGCMGLGGEWGDRSPYTKKQVKEAEIAIETALESNITMFDHADIYKHGKSEQVFGEVLKNRSDLRSEIVLQSKCGIRFADERGPDRFDFSKNHILNSVEESLQRLHTDYLDILLLHRPDPLMEPEEIAEAFDQLKRSGKVKHFGVSNMSRGQMELIQHYWNEPLVVNQIEMSLNRTDWVEDQVLVNQLKGKDLNFPPDLLEYCRLHQVQVQAWAPLSKGIFSGAKSEDLTEPEKKTKEMVQKMAEEKNTTREAIILGWLMRHPQKIQPVIGTTNPERIKSCQDAPMQATEMTREEWYELFQSTRKN